MIEFGTDGWRAVIAEDFTFNNLKIVSQAIADYLKKVKKNNRKVIIGYDCRFLSKEFAETAACVFAGNGIKTFLSKGEIPTPAVSFHCLYNKFDLGIMITASHNPAKFNGLKIKTPEGGTADKNITDKVERLLGKTKVKFIEPEIGMKKKLIKITDLEEEYIRFLKKFVNLKKIRELKLKVLVDIMYGTGNSYVEKVLGSCGVKIDYIHKEFNPSFGGIHPEPVEENLAELIEKVKKGPYDMGVVLDGDADRIAMVDGKGNYVNAQVLLPLLAVHMIKNRKAKGGIGKTIVGSNVIDKVAISLGVACYETPVGFKYLSALFKENLICIGGEEAGGIGFKGYVPERDGSVSFLLLLEFLASEGRKFDNLLSAFYERYGRFYYTRTFILLKNLRKNIKNMELPKVLLGKKVERVNTLDGIKLITKDNWLMFRKSGTEPIVRIYAESKSKRESDKLVKIGEKMIYSL